MDLSSIVGGIAALCTSLSYGPQLRKCWTTGSAGDLSLKTFAILASGVALWIVYGFMKSDMVIVAANVVSLSLLLCILFFKIREDRRTQAGRRRHARRPREARPYRP